jgi:acyl carrier protein
MDTTLEGLIELLQDVKEDVDYETCTTLIDDHVLDSFDILSIISTLNDAYDISIPAAEIVPENFNSAASLLAMVERLIDED